MFVTWPLTKKGLKGYMNLWVEVSQDDLSPYVLDK